MSLKRAPWWLWVLSLSLVVVSLACNLPTRTAPTTPTAAGEAATQGTATPMVMCTPPACEADEVYYCPGECLGGCGTECATPTAAAEAPETPTVSPSPSGPTATPVCSRSAKYVTDVTIPDDSVLAPETAFTKTWRVRNTGSCAWEAGTQLVFVSGEAMSGPAAVDAPVAEAGAEVDISVDLISPADPGTYRGNWQLQAPDGTRFGPLLYLRIVVQEPVTETPTATPTVTPTMTVTPTVTVTPTACSGIDPVLQPAYDLALAKGYDPGCPTGAASTVSGAFQTFWANVDEVNPHLHYRSLMIWRSDTHFIYVIDGQDTDASEGVLLIYPDTWTESQPTIHPDCAAMTPPTGYELPVRGFGKVWCVHHLWDPVGWPADPEAAVSLLIQPTEHGRLIKVSGPIPIGYLIAMDDPADWAVTQMTAP